MPDLALLSDEAEREWLEGWLRGPTKLRWEAPPLQVGDQAPDLELEDEQGVPRRLSSFWEDAPTLILFWRQFGCGCGVDRAMRLRREAPQYREAAGHVIIIAQGEAPRAAAYRAQHQIPCPILCDPDLAAYDQYDVLDGKPSQIMFDAAPELLRREPQAGRDFQAKRKAAGRPPVDSPWRLPAEFVIGKDGVVRLAYRYQHCEDFPDPRILTAAMHEAWTT